MKRIAHVLSGIRRDERGFSMAEVVVAITFFVAAILGAASMMISGASLISGGAMANTAMRLASTKIEEVKSIPYYVPWGGNPADIDDFYWRYGEYGPLSNEDQATAPWRDEEADPDGKYQEYGDIPGFANYKRTTTIQYVYVGSTQLEPAVMGFGWVPSAPDFDYGEFDRPTGGASSSATDRLHMLTIEVKVSYMENGIERTYTERALASDVLESEKVMVVESIKPNIGYRWDANFFCTIKVDAPDMLAGDEVVVTLWRAGTSDIPTVESILRTSSSTTIECHFNLKAATGPAGYYNVSVYWKRMGFKDSLRNSFELREATGLMIGRVTTEDGDSPAWGFEEQTARTLSIDGYGFTGVDAVWLRNGADIVSGGNITVNPDGDNLKATFNLSLPELQGWDPVMKWDLEVHNGAETEVEPGCFILNPEPVIMAVPDFGEYDGKQYFDWANKAQTSRYVKLTGYYLYGLDASNVKLESSGTPVHECVAEKLEAVGESDINHWKRDTWVIFNFDPSTGTAGGFDLDSKCSVVAENCGGVSKTDPDNPTKNFLVNPKPVISVESIPDSAIRKAAEQLNKTVTGSYFTESIPGLDSYLVLVSKSQGPQLGGEHVPCLKLPFTVSPDGTSINCDFDPGKDRFVWLDDFFGQVVPEVPGTAPEFADPEYYDYYLYVLNVYDHGTPGELEQWSAYNPSFTCNIQHGTPKVTVGTVTSGGVNYWNLSLGALLVYCYDTDPGACQIQLWSDDLLTCYDPYEGDLTVDTLSGGPPSVTGTYGNTTAQTVSGLYANLIDIPKGKYRLVLKDWENGKSSSRADSLPFNVNIWAPTVEVGGVSPPSITDDGTRTMTVTSQGFLPSGADVGIYVNWVDYNSPYGFLYPELVWGSIQTVDANRNQKYVKVTASFVIPFKFKPPAGPYTECCLSDLPWNVRHDVLVINWGWGFSYGYGFFSISDN